MGWNDLDRVAQKLALNMVHSLISRISVAINRSYKNMPDRKGYSRPEMAIKGTLRQGT